jgi:hypothetical protein
MPNSKLTTELLAAALRGIAQNYRPADENEALKKGEWANEIAEEALSAVAHCLKFLLANYGEASVEGLGEFVVTNGAVGFQPDDNLQQHVLLSEINPERQAQIIATSVLRNLQNTETSLPLIKDRLDVQLGPHNLTPEDKLLASIFREQPNKSLVASTEYLLNRIIRQFEEAGVSLRIEAIDAHHPLIPTQVVNTEEDETIVVETDETPIPTKREIVAVQAYGTPITTKEILAKLVHDSGQRKTRRGQYQELKKRVLQYRKLAHESRDFEAGLAISLIHLADYLTRRGRHSEAKDAAEEAVRLHRRLAEGNPDFEPILANSLDNFAKKLAKLRKYSQAKARAKEAVRLRRKITQEPSVTLESEMDAVEE